MPEIFTSLKLNSINKTSPQAKNSIRLNFIKKIEIRNSLAFFRSQNSKSLVLFVHEQILNKKSDNKLKTQILKIKYKKNLPRA